MKTTYDLIDTFNKVKISTHFSIKAAVAAQRKHLRAVKKHNGQNSYLTYAIRASDNSYIAEEIMAEVERLDTSW
jgi:hypothetical protein